jgi:peptide deformylase
MEILKAHYKLSKPVSSYKEISAEAKKMMRFVERGALKGFYNKAFAITHSEVSETPYAFFVVAPEVIAEKMFKSRVIINPEIIDAPVYKKEVKTWNINGVMQGKNIPNAIEYDEPCLSFPYRKPKRIVRYDSITVRYQIPELFGTILRTVEEEIHGIASQIFQHEYDHIKGKNIYFESDNPVKWWELIGKSRPVCGESLDQFDPKGLTPAREHATLNITTEREDQDGLDRSDPRDITVKEINANEITAKDYAKK